MRNYYPKANVGEFYLETGTVKVGDLIYVIGPTTGVVQTTVEKMVLDGETITKAGKGLIITVPIKEKIRKNDQLFLITPVKR